MSGNMRNDNGLTKMSLCMLQAAIAARGVGRYAVKCIESRDVQQFFARTGTGSTRGFLEAAAVS